MLAEQQWLEVARKLEQWGWLKRINKQNVNEVADFSHSALLRRMIVEGKDPLPFPSPRYFSYPWYSLIENGKASGVEAQINWHSGKVADNDNVGYDFVQIFIGQMEWGVGSIGGSAGKPEYGVTPDEGKTHWRLWHAEPGKGDWGWALERTE